MNDKIPSFFQAGNPSPRAVEPRLDEEMSWDYQIAFYADHPDELARLYDVPVEEAIEMIDNWRIMVETGQQLADMIIAEIPPHFNLF
jgi:hypothetical protein